MNLNNSECKDSQIKAIKEQITQIGSEYIKLNISYSNLVDEIRVLKIENVELKMQLKKIRQSKSWKTYQKLISLLIKGKNILKKVTI